MEEIKIEAIKVEPEKAEAKAFEVNHLQPHELTFARIGDTLVLTLADGRRYPRVVLRSCFPVSLTTQYLSVLDASGEEQKEIGIIDDWSLLEGGSKQAVSEEIGLYYFVPQITRILKIKKEFGFIYWTVDTNKGSKEFVMRDSVVHYAREVAPDRWLIIDVNQARYEIPDVSTLDSRSISFVRRFLYL